jgi:hypothetical protein
VDGLFGSRRQLLKRAASFDALRHSLVHRRLSGRSYDEKIAIADRLAAALARRTGAAIPAGAIVIDAPPAEREVEFRLSVRERLRRTPGAEGFCWRSFAELSPVVRSLAHEQFDDLVKQVRVFVAADVAEVIRGCGSLEDLLLEAAQPA